MTKKQSQGRPKSKDKIDSSRAFFYCSVAILLLAMVLLSIAIHTERCGQASTKTTAFSVGQQIISGQGTITISTVKHSSGSAHFKAPADSEYLILNLKVNNNGTKPINVLPAADTYLKDTSGNVVYLTPFELSQPFRSGELLPGEQIQGQLSYLVKKSKSYALYIDSTWSGRLIEIKL
jgi:hypothetical protein